MDDLERMQRFYDEKDKNEWLDFNCYSFFLSCKQKYIITKILKDINTANANLLDIGAGEGNFILHLMSLGVKPSNITAVEYLKERFDLLKDKLPHIKSINQNFLNMELNNKYDIVTIMAVLTSLTDNELRYNIFKKALQNLSDGGVMILYDYFDDSEKFLNSNYRCISLKKILHMSKDYKVTIYKKVYLKSKIAKGLCKIKLPVFIPIAESLRIFNDNYHFMVIKNAE